jgi:hypothetical protein
MTTIALHRRVLLSLLQQIYKHPALSPALGFKGGTCLYFLYQLPRFSVDLDFNLVQDTSTFSPEAMQSILETELQLNDVHEKEHTWLWNGIYKPGEWNVKVEVSKRIFADTYENKELFGLTVQTLQLEYQLSHKLCAITDRTTLVNRDLFDAHFLLKKHISPVEEIIEQRTGMSCEKYLRSLLEFIPEHISKRGPLDGLGELLDPELKTWVQTSLVEELLFFLESYVEEM